MTTYPLHKLSWPEFQNLANVVIQHEYKYPVKSFRLLGRDGGRDGAATTINNKELVVQAKHTSDPNAKLTTEILRKRFIGEEERKISSLVNDKMCHYYYAVTNFSVTAGQNKEFIQEVKAKGVEVADLIGKESLDRWISGMPTKLLMNFPCLCSDKKELFSEKLKEEYKEETKTLKQTKSFASAKTNLQEKNVVFLLGEEKSGKTSMMKQLALISGTIMPVIKAKDFNDNAGEQSCIFMVDDVFGKWQKNDEETTNWDKSFEFKIISCSIYTNKNKIIMTSRNQIYKNVKNELCENFRNLLENSYIDLSQDEDLQNEIVTEKANSKQLESECLKFREDVKLLEGELKIQTRENETLQEHLRKKMESEKVLKDTIEKQEAENVYLERENKKFAEELNVSNRILSQAERDLVNKRSELTQKDESIKKLNRKNLQLQEALDEKEESLRQEEKLRMTNMKSLDQLKMKLEKMEKEDKKNRERIFNLKSACSEANEAYEIVKRQNISLKEDIQLWKEKFKEKDNALEIALKEKDKLSQEILNASRSIDDMRKHSTRDCTLSISMDSALGESINSSSDLYSIGPESPTSTISESNSLFVDSIDGKKIVPENGLLSTMPIMVENFRAVVQENGVLKGKLLEIVSSKEKLDRKVPDLEQLTESLKKDLVAKDESITQQDEQVMELTKTLDDTKAKLEETDSTCRAVQEKYNITKILLEKREQAINDLQECVEILQEKEKALELYSKSVSEKFEFESSEKKKLEQLNENLLQKKNELCNELEMVAKKLKERNQVIEPCDVQNHVTMTTIDSQLDALLQHTEDLEKSLSAANTEYSELQQVYDNLQKETISLEEYQKARDEIQQHKMLLEEQEAENKIQQVQMEEANRALQTDLQEKKELLKEKDEKRQALELTVQSLKQMTASFEASDESHRTEIEELKRNLQIMEENMARMENELNSAGMKQTEVEITNKAYRDENAKLRSDLLSLTEAKCKVESEISELQRQEKKLLESIEKEQQEKCELERKYGDVCKRCDNLENEVIKANEETTLLSAEQEKSQKSKEILEKQLLDYSNESSQLKEELSMARKDLADLEGRYLIAAKNEEDLQQKLSIQTLETSKLNTAYEASVKRKNAVEKSMIDLTVRGEELEMALEKATSEKAAAIKENCQKEETIHKLEAKKSELDEERQQLVNDLYFSTRKVLAMYRNLDSLRNEFSAQGKELKGLAHRSGQRKPTSDEQDGTSESDYEQSVVENEMLIQNLRQSIKTSERNLDKIRQEARITDLENRSCQKQIDCIYKEFAFLKDHLSNIKHSCQKMSDETKSLRDELCKKEDSLKDANDKIESLEEMKTADQEAIAQLQSRTAELDNLCAEYEAKLEEAHNDLIKKNQQVANLEANLSRTEQKKFIFEKELLVSNEKISGLESFIRSMKDESRGDKKTIATLEVEYAEKQTILRDYQRTEDAHTQLKVKFEELQREKEEMAMDLSNTREELCQEQSNLKSARKEAENIKKTIWNEKNLREKVEQELRDKVEKCKTYKNHLQDLQKALARHQDENAALEDKVKTLEGDSSSLKRETSVQTVEMKRLEGSLCELKQQLIATNQNYEASERQRKKLTEDFVHSEEELSKLQGTCEELLKEKAILNDKIASMNEAMEILITGHEEAETSLKQELLTTKKELSVAQSALDRNQQKVSELQEEVKTNETKWKTLGSKNKEVLDKFWGTQNQLTEVETQNGSLRTEVKDLRDKHNVAITKISELEDLLKTENEENEKELSATNDKLAKLRSQNTKTLEERDELNEKLHHVESALERLSEDFKNSSTKFSAKEILFKNEMVQKDECLADMQAQNDKFQQDLKRTSKMLKESCLENKELNERLKTALEKLDELEQKNKKINNESEDLFAEAQAKMNIVQKLKAPLRGADEFANISPQSWMDEEDSDEMSPLPSPRPGNPISSVNHLIDSFHRTCLSAFSDNKILRGRLAEALADSAQLDDALQREKNDMAEIKRYLNESDKRKSKLEDENKKLLRRMEMLKKKNTEFEKEKDEEIAETKGNKAALEVEIWKLRERLEEARAKLKVEEEEKWRYLNELEESRQQVVDVQAEVKTSLNKLDEFQENALSLKRRIFELEASEKSLHQNIQEKEKLLYANQQKVLELEKMYESCNQKKTELFSKVSKAEDKIANLESECQERERHKEALGDEIACLKKSVIELEEKLLNFQSLSDEMKEKCNDLETQNRSQKSAKETLENLLNISKEKMISFEEVLDKQKEENESLKKELWQIKKEKDDLESGHGEVLQLKDNIQENLVTTKDKLGEVESNFVKTFQENEALKRQNLKLETDACAERARLQDEVGKLKAENGSLKKEVTEKEKNYSDQQARFKLLERENEFLRKDLANIHGKQSQLKLDLTSTNSKLQSYVMERENWEQEVKSVLSEMEKEKGLNHSKERQITSQRMRYEQDINFLQQKVDALVQELKVVQESNEQQRHAEEISNKLALEAKDMEIDTLRMRLQAKHVHAGDKLIVYDAMKGQLDERGKQIEELMEQMEVLKESYKLELASLQEELKCAQMENMLKTKSEGGNSFLTSDSYNSLLESIKASRRESERLRQLLGQKMNDMRILKRQILTDRSYPHRILGAGDLTPPPKHYGYGQGVSRCLDMVPTKDEHFVSS